MGEQIGPRMKRFLPKSILFPSTFNIHPQMRVVDFSEKVLAPEKSGLPQYSSHPQKHEPEEMNSIVTAGAFHKHSFRKENALRAMGYVTCISSQGCHLPSLPPSPIVSLSSSAVIPCSLSSFCLWNQLPIALLPTSWAPVTIHLPCGMRNPCVW